MISEKTLLETAKIITDLRAVVAELEAELAEERKKWVICHCLNCYRLESELAGLKEFARHVIQIECWSLYEQDGGDLQDLAEKLGLIEQHTATVADVDEESDFEVGDIIYKFTDILKGAKT